MIGFLQGRPGGKVSMMRVATMIVVTTIMSVWAAQNIIAMIHGCGFVSMGSEEAMLIALTLGAKAAQQYGEAKANGKPPTTNDIPSDKTQ